MHELFDCCHKNCFWVSECLQFFEYSFSCVVGVEFEVDFAVFLQLLHAFCCGYELFECFHVSHDDFPFDQHAYELAELRKYCWVVAGECAFLGFW